MRKFAGLMTLAVMTAFIGLVSMPTISPKNAEAGLLRNIFGGRAFSGCGGGGGLQYGSYSGCGGGGLQMAYSSCSGGGGGLQSAYYAPPQFYSAPVQYTPVSGCPGGVCPPGVGGGLVMQPSYAPIYQVASIPPGIRVAPGESYVVGSLREVRTVQAPQVARSAPKATPTQTASLPEYDEIYQITQDGCHNCEHDRQLSRQAGVDLKVLNMSVVEDAFKIASLWGQTGEKLVGTPAYILVRNGKAVKWRTKAIGSSAEFARLLDKKIEAAPAIAKEDPTPAQPLSNTDQKLDRIEAAILELAKEIRESRRETRTASLN